MRTEQQRFYRTKAWQRLSKSFLESKHYICERCGNPAGIAHHKIHLNGRNVNDPSIALNADNLEALCIECHNKEHYLKYSAVADGLCFDDDGNIIPIDWR